MGFFCDFGGARRNVGPPQLADRILHRFGLVRGQADIIGASEPDVVCSWGTGWSRHWDACAGRARVVVTGSPRNDMLREVSPPLGIIRVSCYAASRYGNNHSGLLLMKSMAGTSGLRRRWQLAALSYPVRIRLHPIEMERLAELPLSPHVHEVLDRSSLGGALEWARWHVLAPASTILLEALATGRAGALTCAFSGLERLWERSYLLRGPPLAPCPGDSPAGRRSPRCNTECRFPASSRLHG